MSDRYLPHPLQQELYDRVMAKVSPSLEDYKCDRCFNRKTKGLKRFPVRQENLCDDCKNQMELLNYVTEEL